MADVPTMAEARTYGSCACGKRYLRVTRRESGAPPGERFAAIDNQSASITTCTQCGAPLASAWRLSAPGTLGLVARHG